MSSSSTQLFDDDFAVMVRDGFHQLLTDGHTAEAATAHLVATQLREVTGTDDELVFWLALARAQWECGRLLAHVRLRAIAIIDSGQEPLRWNNGSGQRLTRRRQRVLDRLRDQLTLPNPKPRRLRRPWKEQTEWNTGHAIAYQLLSGYWVVMRVVMVSDEDGRRVPIMDVTDLVGPLASLPTEPSELASATRRRGARDRAEHARLVQRRASLDSPGPQDSNDLSHRSKLAHWDQFIDAHQRRSTRFLLERTNVRDGPGDRARILATGLPLKPEHDSDGIIGGTSWRSLDAFLRSEFDLG